MELSCRSLPADVKDRDASAVSQLRNKVYEARSIDRAVIRELANERKLLNAITVFFTSMIKHYALPDVQDGDESVDEEKVVVANVFLMKIRQDINEGGRSRGKV